MTFNRVWSPPSIPLISIASDYNITEFLTHKLVHAILKSHGMVTISKRPMDVVKSIFIYIFYPLIYINKKWRMKYSKVWI